MDPHDIKDNLRDKGYSKAARFLMLLGKEEAARVMKHLDEEEVAGITKEIAQVDKIDSSEAAKILEEFGYLIKTQDLVARGGIGLAESILRKAFDEDRATALISRLKNRTAPHPFSFLMDLDFDQVRLLLKDESAPVLTAILPHLSPDRAAELLHSLDEELQLQVVKRMATLKEINPEVLRQAEGALKDKIRAQGQIVTEEIDGQAVLAEILRNMKYVNEREIMEQLELSEPALAKEIEKKLLTMDILLRISDRDLQSVLRDFSDNELALLCKGLNEKQVTRVRSNLSARRWASIIAESEDMGAVFRSEVDKAFEDFLDYIKLQKEKGEISIIKDGDKVVE
ncbi:MAG: flagellar motor switch protein FliG [Spirochaetaceae bacterium]|nr:MAG: flagellar motor switch protein FliG [Spirochaetaceae bacterium]